MINYLLFAVILFVCAFSLCFVLNCLGQDLEEKYNKGTLGYISQFGKHIQTIFHPYTFIISFIVYLFFAPCVYEFGSVFYQQYMVIYSPETKVSTLHKVPWYGQFHSLNADVYAFTMLKGEETEQLKKKIFITDTEENKRIFLPVSCTLEYPKFIQQTTRITKETKGTEPSWSTRLNERVFMERLGETLQQADVPIDQLPNVAEDLIQKWLTKEGYTSVVCKIESTVNPQRNVEIGD